VGPATKFPIFHPSPLLCNLSPISSTPIAINRQQSFPRPTRRLIFLLESNAGLSTSLLLYIVVFNHSFATFIHSLLLKASLFHLIILAHFQHSTKFNKSIFRVPIMLCTSPSPHNIPLISLPTDNKDDDGFSLCAAAQIHPKINNMISSLVSFYFYLQFQKTPA